MDRTHLRGYVMHNLNRIRKEKGLTIMQLAELVHYSEYTVEKWDYSKRRAGKDSVENVANALGVTVNELIEVKNENENECECMELKFPKKAKYKRDPNRIYFSDDFKDGQIVEFSYHCEKPSSKSKGYAWYKGDKPYPNLINIRDLVNID